MSDYVFSPSLLQFFRMDWKSDYEKAGSWPRDPVDVANETAGQFLRKGAPTGMMLGADPDGQPSWVPAPPT